MTPKQAAQALGRTVAGIQAMCRSGKIYALKRPLPGGTFVYEIHESDVEYLREHQPRKGPRRLSRVERLQARVLVEEDGLTWPQAFKQVREVRASHAQPIQS